MNRIKREDILEIIRKMNLEIDVDMLDPDGELGQQGIDSLDMMNLFFELEEMCSINITDESLDSKGWRTIDEIVENMNKLISA